MPTLNSHTHCQVAPADPQAKTWQRVCLFLTHGQKDNAAKMKDKMTGKINNETLTTCIKHLAVSGLSSVSARIKSSCNLIRNRFEMPNVSYTQPLAFI